MELVGSVYCIVRVLNKPGCGKTMRSVFEGGLPVPMCISISNQEKC